MKIARVLVVPALVAGLSGVASAQDPERGFDRWEYDTTDNGTNTRTSLVHGARQQRSLFSPTASPDTDHFYVPTELRHSYLVRVSEQTDNLTGTSGRIDRIAGAGTVLTAGTYSAGLVASVQFDGTGAAELMRVQAPLAPMVGHYTLEFFDKPSSLHAGIARAARSPSSSSRIPARQPSLATSISTMGRPAVSWIPSP